MEKDYDDDSSSSRCSRQGVLLRLLVAAFALITILLLIIAIALIITQKPVDLGVLPDSEEDFENITSQSSHQQQESSFSSQQYHRRKSNYNRFTFDQLFSGKLFLKDSYDYNWLPDGSLLRRKDEFLGTSADVLRTPPDSFESTVFIDDADLMKTLSADQQYAYRTKIIRQLFRHSTERVYEIVSIINGTASKVSWPVGPNENSTVQAFYWNPSSKSHDFVFVHNYNIYYQSDPEKPETAVQLTTDGEYFYRYGVANWLYEEEILDDSSALWWSPSGRYVSYLRFDDRQVNRIFLPTYTNDDPYVEYFELPYPKAGVTQNTLVSQFIWDREKNKIVEAVAPDELRAENQSYYIMQNKWMAMPTDLVELGNERLVTVWSNREQNRVFYTLCNEIDCLLTYVMSFTIGGRNMWIEPHEVGNIFPTKTGFFTILPHSWPDNNIYNHVAHIELENTGTGKITKWIGENFDVSEILGYWQEKDILTFQGYGTEVGTKNIYKIPKAANQKLKDSISAMNALVPNCQHGVYSVCPTGKRAVLLCHSPFENTKFYLMSVDKPRTSELLEGSDEAHLPFDKLNISYDKMDLPSGIEVHYTLILPPKYDASDKLPLVLDLYGGPNSKKVCRNTPAAQFIQICSQYEVAILQIDVSGTTGRGWNIKAPVYKKIGQMETRDTLDAIRYITDKYPFLDPDNVAVMGWSYGGYLSSQIALRDLGETVKCAISIAPVTDFKYYDTAYTERYLGLPSENPSGYAFTNLIPHARNLTNVKYFLAHGEKDDNVHYQNSARWSEALQLENIHFTQLVYANEAHNLQGKIQHLYSEIQRFLIDDCFEAPSLKFH